MIRADMHIHTYYSDGLQSPADVVEAAKSAGLKLISVTDHDTMGASSQTALLAEAAGIYAVAGLEISAYNFTKVHMLGYGMDTSCPEYAAYYKRSVEGSFARCEDMLSKLSARGIALTMDEVLAERRVEGTPVHSMHLCRAAAKKGYAPTAGAFYLAYIIDGKAGHSRIGRLTPEEAVKTILACGGLPSLAHPGRIRMEREAKERMIAELASLGLWGIEAVYSGHTDEETVYYKEMARTYGLAVTGGSDTHFRDGPRRVGVPEFYPSAEVLRALKIC